MKTSDLLSVPELRITLGVAGDLEQEIEWMHAIDWYPASEFVSGGGIALTAGQWWPRVRAADYVADLITAGVIGLGFGLTSSATDLPAELLAACEAHGLTFFLVPVEVPFVRVIGTFVDAQRDTWERPLRRQLTFHARFAATLRRDRSIETMLRALGDELGMQVALVADRAVFGGDSVDSMHPVPLESEGVVDASLYLDQDPATLALERRAALAIGMPFIALEIERIRSVRSTVDGYTRELFTWLRLGDHDPLMVLARLESLGVPIRSRMAILAIGGGELDVAILAIRREFGPSAVAARMDDRVLVCMSDAADDVLRRLATVLPRAAQAGFGSVGGPERLRLSLIQAEHALQLAQRVEGSRVVGAESLSSPSSILRSAPSDLLLETATALLRPLQEYDEARGGHLVRTLSVLLEHGGRLSAAAQELYVHTNTLRHRIQLIEDITGRSFDRTRDRTDFDLALSLLRDAEHPGSS